MEAITQLLDDYEVLLQDYQSIIELEMAHLKEARELDESLAAPKQQLIENLGTNLAKLKSYRESMESLDPDLRQRLDQLQQKFMKVIKLDRELEKQYLGQQSAQNGSLRSAGQFGADRAAARRLYGLS
ncbi:MAG: hypothetical protein ACLFS1_05420 [Opitutales bacterium]